MNRAQAFQTLGLVGAGIVLGIVVQVLSGVGRTEARYPVLQRTDEPQIAALVADAIRRDDAAALIGTVGNADLLSKLHKAITPIVAVSDVKFIGATMAEGRVFAAYVVKGPTESGFKVARGLVLHVQHGEVVFVN